MRRRRPTAVLRRLGDDDVVVDEHDRPIARRVGSTEIALDVHRVRRELVVGDRDHSDVRSRDRRRGRRSSDVRWGQRRRHRAGRLMPEHRCGRVRARGGSADESAGESACDSAGETAGESGAAPGDPGPGSSGVASPRTWSTRRSISESVRSSSATRRRVDRERSEQFVEGDAVGVLAFGVGGTADRPFFSAHTCLLIGCSSLSLNAGIRIIVEPDQSDLAAQDVTRLPRQPGRAPPPSPPARRPPSRRRWPG